MSFNREELEAHCDEIIKDPAIGKHTIIVLCEGNTRSFKKTEHALSKDEFEITQASVLSKEDGTQPIKQTKRALSIKEECERTQDSAFFYKAIPDWWRTTGLPEPRFYVCGNQKNVIDAFFYLKAKHQIAKPQESYLNSQRLVALVDIDLPNRKIQGDYAFADLAGIYQDLYSNGKVSENCHNHGIWVTGLLHKEAYFLVPELQALLAEHLPTPMWNEDLVDLASVYHALATNMAKHQDISDNFTKAKTRIQHHALVTSPSVEAFQTDWRNHFNDPQITESEKNTLVYVLLTLAKSKPVWEQIKSTIPSGDHKNYRDELCLKIGKQFYAKQPRESEQHLPRFFAAMAASLQST